MTDMWRIPSSKVVQSGRFCFVEDRGMLTRAVVSSKTGNYLFSEVGAGVNPLALIGMHHGIVHFLNMHSARRIENRIATLPDIYMGVAFYTPGKRYKMLDPVGDSALAIVKGIADMAPGTTLTDAAGAAGTIFEMIRSLFKKKKPKHSLSSTKLYVKFSYLEEKGMVKIGTGSVAMSDIRVALARVLPQVV